LWPSEMHETHIPNPSTMRHQPDHLLHITPGMAVPNFTADVYQGGYSIASVAHVLCRSACLTLFCFFLASQTSYAQSGIPGNGMIADHDYVHDAIDSVDLDSGNIILHIPIVTYKQRGTLPDFTLVARYNSPQWFISADERPIIPTGWIIASPSQVDQQQAYQNFPNWNYLGGGVQVVRGDALSTGVYDLPFTDDNNEPNDYYVTYVEDGTGAQHFMYLPSGSTNARAMDGSGIAATGSDIRGNLVKIIDANGVTHSAVGDSQADGFFDALNDPFGNTVTPAIVNVFYFQGYIQQVDHWVDSIGRNIPAPPGGNIGVFTPGCYTYQYPSASNSTEPYSFCYTSISVGTSFGMSNVSDYGPQQHTVLSSIGLPNGKSYTFGYDSWGMLHQIALPSGGVISYTYVTGVAGPYSRRGLQTRTVDPGDGTPARTWTFAGSGVTDPNGSETVQNPYQSPTTKSIVQYQGAAANGVVAQSTVSTYCPTGDVFWLTPSPPPKLICQKDITLSDGETYRETTTYDTAMLVGDPITTQECCGGLASHSTTGQKSIGLPVAQAVTDFGATSPGPTLKTTTTHYLWETHPTYLQANFLLLPSSTTISNGSGSTVSQTTFGYDENNGSPQGVYGNQTSLTKCCDSAGHSVEATFVYNGQGMVTDTYDGNSNAGGTGNHVNTAYDSTGLFASAVTQSATGNIQHIDYYSYDGNTGAMNWHTDQNGTSPGDTSHTTVYTHDDPLGRLTLTQYPDGGSVQVNYNGDPSPPKVTVTTATGLSTPPRVEIYQYDGLGRLTQGQLNDPDGTIYTDVQYDPVGHIASVSNPYRSTSDPTFGYTSYAYDALGRKVMQCQPDNGNSLPCTRGNSYLEWIYNGNITDIYDESRNHSRQTWDALRRLTNVVEPNGASTGYIYDTLGNLKTVNQLGVSGETPRSRSFTYDSLSRLLTASNPETGTVCYGQWSGNSCVNGYDANGNLNHKTDARGVSVNYSYDQLNRMILKTASDGSFIYSYAYDGTDRPGVQNPIGRLTQSSNNANAASDYDYDAMGRVVDNYVCAPLYCTYTLGAAATYDLAGNMVTSRIATGMTAGLSYDAVGRLQGVTTTPSGSSTASTLFSNTTYGPVGLIEASLGNGLREELSYDKRSRVNSYAVGQANGPGSGGTPPFGYIENAVNNGSGSSSIPQGGLIRSLGWAADTEDGAPVAKIELLLDGNALGLATLGGSRPDVAAAYSRSDFTNSGWNFTGSIGNVAPGTHTISAVAYDWSGNASTLTNLSQTITVTSDSPPFGYIEPVTGVATGTSTVPAGGLITMFGWAADTEDGVPVASVRVLLDGVPMGNATLGLSRPDVATAYNRSDFTNSGWSFTGSIRAASTGTHTVTAVAYDSSGNEAVLTSSYPITVITNSQSMLSAMDGVANASNSNSNMINLGGSITVSGWSAEPDQNPGAPVARVEVEIDGQFLGLATLGGQRPDVASASNRPDYLSSGWTFTGPVTNVDPGEHSIGARAYTQNGGSYSVPIVQQNQEIIVAGTTPPLSVGASPTKYSYALDYAPNGNIVNAADSVNGNWAYSYDSLNRLTSALSPSTGVSWSYDSFGNRGQQTPFLGSAPSPVATYSTATNRLDGVCYDAAGNVLDDGPCPQYGAHKYAYDAEEKLISSNYGSTVYIYDAEGRRVGKADSGTVTNVYFYDVAGHGATEVNGAGAIVRSEIYAGTRHLATYQGANIFYNHANWLGTEVARSDTNGTLCETMASLPFGDAQQTSGSCFPSPAFFTGKERDTESGLDYFGARYYASNMGRFMSPDPGKINLKHLANPQKWNKYAYVLNNPLSLVDPDGMEEMWIQYRAFIPQSNVGIIKGDGRTFSAQENASSRASITMHIETDPAKNGGHPLLGYTQDVSSTHNNLTGNNTPPIVTQAPTATGSQDPVTGQVTLNVQMNVRSGDAGPLDRASIRSDVNIGVNQAGTQGTVQGTVSGSPAFETNFAPQGGPTTNLPIQGASPNPATFIWNLPNTNMVNKQIPIQQSPQEQHQQ
jgi:RHS repeat-associated protein